MVDVSSLARLSDMIRSVTGGAARGEGVAAARAWFEEHRVREAEARRWSETTPILNLEPGYVATDAVIARGKAEEKRWYDLGRGKVLVVGANGKLSAYQFEEWDEIPDLKHYQA